MNIYEDASRSNVVLKHLYENKTYYIDFEDTDEEKITSEIKSSKLTQFITWQHGNRFATLSIMNFIGNIYFFGNTYDVKSQKFLTGLTGTEQFQSILNDIQDLSKNIIFTYSSPSFAIRQVDYTDANPTLMLMFNYFKRIILEWGKTDNLESSLHRVMSNPNFKYDAKYKVDKIEKIKKFDSKTLRALVSDQRHYVKLDATQTHLINLPVTKFISQNTSDNYFPTKTLMKKKFLSYDTSENRFIKFFIRYIEGIAYRLNSVKGLPKNVVEEKEQVLSFCRTTLNQPFFKYVGEMSIIPTHSTVLQSRSGYKDILGHFTRSRFGIKHIFEEFEQEAMSIDLKRISDLYEYWVFYKIAITFLGKDIIIEQQNLVLKNGEVTYGVCFRDDNVAVYYNFSESRHRKSAYSVRLRPDTTVVIKKDEKVIKFVFDAKYKVQYKEDEEGMARHVKSEDIYKMHTYLDAIENCIFAIAIYPGTKFYFYEKDLTHSVRTDVSSILTFHGVGAIPLVPNDEILNNQFIEFVNSIKKKFIKSNIQCNNKDYLLSLNTAGKVAEEELKNSIQVD